MKIQFNQKQFKKSPLALEIRNLIHFCVPKTSRYRQHLVVKVMFYTNGNYGSCWRGHYACLDIHGLYRKDIDAGFDSEIVLKIGQNIHFDTMLYLIAHEVGHHITWVKDKRFGEKKADKIAEKIIERYCHKH